MTILRVNKTFIIAIIYLLPMGLIALEGVQPELTQVTPESLFRRCYSNLTGRFAAWNNELLVKVRSGEIDALEACESILDKATLNDAGYMPTEVDSLGTLRNLHNLHGTWFVVDDPDAVSDEASGAANAFDNQEGSLYFTRALFDPEKDISFILRANKVPMGLRDGAEFDLINRHRQATPDGDSGIPVCDAESKTCSCAGDHAWCYIKNSAESSPLVQRGKLVGVTDREGPEHTLVNQKYKPLDDPSCLVGPNFNAYRDRYCLQGQTNADHLGGGILGSSVYFQYNTPARYQSARAPVHIARRWSKNFFKTFMCRDLPLVKQFHPEVDLKSMTTPKGESWILEETDIPYRKNISCMECHSSMDQMAYVTRKFMAVNTFPGGNPLNPVMLTINKMEDFSASCDESNDVKKYFCDHEIFDLKEMHKSGVHSNYSIYSKALSRLYYVDVNGSLINEQVDGHLEMAEALLKKDDVYACVASRYFEHFMGISVNLDPFIEYQNKLSESDRAYKELVLELGQSLKKTQNVKALIKEIMNLPLYKRQLPRLAEDGV